MCPTFRIRPADGADAALVLRFIRRLAEYEGMSEQVAATEDGLRTSLEQRECRAIIGEENGRPVAFALYFFNYSTFLGKHGLYIEDIFVDPESRGKGYGKRIFRHLAQTACQCGCGRMEWWCLDWNTPSIGFYRNLGAVPMSDWTVYRLAGDDLYHLGETDE